MAGPIELAPAPESVRQARRWIREQTIELGVAGLADEAGLLVSELISNVVLHARTPCTVDVVRTETHLRVEVADASPRSPSVPSNREPMAQSGRGMQLVDRIASAHGTIDRGDAGKTVWFELAIRGDDGH